MLRARLAILLAAVLWSTGGAAIKLTGLSGWQVGAGRSVFAAAFLFAAFRSARARPDRRILVAAAAYAPTVIAFSVANKLTTSANAIFIQDTAPLWVVLLSPLLLGERPSRGEREHRPGRGTRALGGAWGCVVPPTQRPRRSP